MCSKSCTNEQNGVNKKEGNEGESESQEKENENDDTIAQVELAYVAEVVIEEEKSGKLSILNRQNFL